MQQSRCLQIYKFYCCRHGWHCAFAMQALQAPSCRSWGACQKHISNMPKMALRCMVSSQMIATAQRCSNVPRLLDSPCTRREEACWDFPWQIVSTDHGCRKALNSQQPYLAWVQDGLFIFDVMAALIFFEVNNCLCRCHARLQCPIAKQQSGSSLQKKNTSTGRAH